MCADTLKKFSNFELCDCKIRRPEMFNKTPKKILNRPPDEKSAWSGPRPRLQRRGRRTFLR